MGILYVVSTPIGNLKDITLRAIDVLKSVDVIVCEDTRVSSKLLHEYDVEKPLIAVNDFNEVSKVDHVLSFLRNGQNVALISDAGTPLVSDPGYKIVREAIGVGFSVESIPGASAVIAALTISGLPPDKFLFVGYLPKKDKKRRDFLENIKKTKEIVKTTVIFFESPFRLVDTLDDVQGVFGDIDICICRELTKIHEEIHRGKVSSSLEHFKKTTPKGEFTIVI